MKRYLVTLEPEGRYFFGDAHGYDDTYIVRSKKLPPLSTVLGTIRKTLLMQAKILSYRMVGSDVVEGLTSGKNKNDIEELIGDFDYNKKPGGSLGKIHSVSPVFVVRKPEMQLFFPLPLNWQIIDKVPVRREPDLQAGLTNNFGGSDSDTLVYLKDYVAKEGIACIWVEVSSWADLAAGKATPMHMVNYLTDEDIFVEHRHPGISRGGSKSNGRIEYIQSPTEQSYFQKVDFTLKDDVYCFGILADMEDDAALSAAGVEMGGDRSFFCLGLQEFNCNKNNELLKSLTNPAANLEKDSWYAVLSETNLNSFKTSDYLCLNNGKLEKQRRMVLPRNAGSSSLPYRMKLKGAVSRSLPAGTLIRTQKDIIITAKCNQAAGVDRFIKL
jgi:hypothetical protein